MNWSTFNIVMFRGIGRPRAREGDGVVAGLWSGQNTPIHGMSLLSYVGAIHGAPKQLQ